MSETLAVFDLEGTLCQGGTLVWKEFLKRCNQKPGGIFRSIAHIIYQTLYSLMLKLRLVSDYNKRCSAIKGMAQLLKGLSQKDMDEFAVLIADRVMTVLRPDIVGILNEHKRQGHRVILSSSLFTPILEEVGRRLAVDYSFGTDMEIKGSLYTGNVTDAICFGERRVSRLKEYIHQSSIEVDFSKSYAYGDTKWDQEVLALVGNPAAVYPDKTLKACAQNNGWKIIS
jgi:HAD superfamily hydrolase (TIGR01490 family)